MPIQIIPGATAWQTFMSNEYKAWPNRRNPDRLYPIASAYAQQSFTLNKNDTFFCIGSCFAREIELTLKSLKYNVLSMPELNHIKDMGRGITNKYNLPSIKNELEWALEEGLAFDNKLFYPTGGNSFQDYHLIGARYAADTDTLFSIRKLVTDTFKKLKAASVIVITLGLSEAWFDKENGCYLNNAPSKFMVQQSPERFELHVLDYNESYDYLEAIYALLRKHVEKDFKMIVTVSPVPLQVTFRNQDVLSANACSKAVLRSVVEAFSVNKSNVDYFPSYELATLSEPHLVWADEDFRHVESHFVEYIMASAMEQYLFGITDNNAETSDMHVAKAKVLYRAGYTAEAKKVLDGIPKSQLGANNVILKNLIRSGLSEVHVKKLMQILLKLKRQRFKDFIDLMRYKLFHSKKKKNLPQNNRITYGFVDSWDGETLLGWVHNKNSSVQFVKVVIEGEEEVLNVTADQEREDVAKELGIINLKCGFMLKLKLDPAKQVLIHILEGQTGDELFNSPFYSNRLFS